MNSPEGGSPESCGLACWPAADDFHAAAQRSAIHGTGGEPVNRAGLLGLAQEDIIVGEAGGIGSIEIGGRKPDCRKLVRVAAVGKVTPSCWGEGFSAIFIFG